MKKSDKRKLGLFILPLVLSLFLIPLVSAAPQDVANDIQTSLDYATEAANPVIGWLIGTSPGGQYLLVKFLFFLVILSIVYYAADKVPMFENKAIKWIVTLVVSVLAVRFLASQQIVEFIWLPTGVIGVVFASLLPFVLFFFLMENIDSKPVRTVGWVAFAVIFIGLSIYRWDKLATGEQWWSNLGWMYLAIALLSVLALIFDSTIRGFVKNIQLGRKITRKNIRQISKLYGRLEEWNNVAANTNLTGDQRREAREKVKEIRKEIADLEAEA